jgi:protein-S-isoprenylcysteine O-methyltransferase Ste14
MKAAIAFLLKATLTIFIWFVLRWAFYAPISVAVNLMILVGGPLLVYPVVWLGRIVLDRHRTKSWAVWTTTFVHFSLGFFLGIPLLRAIATWRSWPGPALPVPPAIGSALVFVTGAACTLTVVNLALRGLGAPFFIALSRRMATDWMYAWTRNPMVLTVLAFLVSLGIRYQSLLFVLWVLIVLAPAELTFVKVFEECELEIRFGAPYLDYKSRTQMLFPRRPKKSSDKPPRASASIASEPLITNR